MKQYGFGVDIGGTTCKIGLFDMSGVILEKWEIKTNTENKGAAILDDVTAAVLGKLEERGISKEDVQGIGVGVPGPINSKGVVDRCVNLGWENLDVVKELSEKTGFPVKAGNDVNVAALGEMWQGGGKGHENVVMVAPGTGLGGGIIVNGKIVAGAHGAGGEVGHILMCEGETETCGCGRHGCLEQYVSATGLVRLAKKKMKEENCSTSLSGFENLTAKDVFDEAKAEDAVALELVDAFCEMLGKALSYIAGVVDPEIFVIGGGVSRAGDILVDGVRKHYREKVFQACADTEIALASLGNDAGMYGCVRMLL